MIDIGKRPARSITAVDPDGRRQNNTIAWGSNNAAITVNLSFTQR
jgi:hypothetical protein